jgi:hypothetical protein
MRKRSTKAELQERIQLVIDLRTQKKLSYEKISTLLVTHFQISKRTIQRIIQKAKREICTLDAVGLDEDFGLVNNRYHDMYTLERNKPNPDTSKLSKINQTHSKFLKERANLKGGEPFERHPKTTSAEVISPELQSILDGFGSAETNSP